MLKLKSTWAFVFTFKVLCNSPQLQCIGHRPQLNILHLQLIDLDGKQLWRCMCNVHATQYLEQLLQHCQICYAIFMSG